MKKERNGWQTLEEITGEFTSEGDDIIVFIPYCTIKGDKYVTIEAFYNTRQDAEKAIKENAGLPMNMYLKYPSEEFWQIDTITVPRKLVEFLRETFSSLAKKAAGKKGIH